MRPFFLKFNNVCISNIRMDVHGTCMSYLYAPLHRTIHVELGVIQVGWYLLVVGNAQSDCYLESLRLAGVRLRDSEDMGARPRQMSNITLLRRHMRHGWKAIQHLYVDFDEATVLPSAKIALSATEKVRL